MYVDLHMHTTESDGRLSPTELMELAASRGLKIIALTDHDTTQGLDEAYRAVSRFEGLTLIPGIELSTDIPGNEIHILGYFLNYRDAGFQQTLQEFRAARYDRGQRMVEKLRELGIVISWERVLELAQGGAGSVGRPHVAQAMVEAGYVPSVREAFDLYIGRNGPAYAERAKLAPEEAVELIRSVGGLAVLAHPKELMSSLDAILDGLCEAGLAGMEAYYYRYEGDVQQRLLAACQERNLVPCGGSDFHGIHGNAEAGLGNVDVPMETAERLAELARQRQPNP